MHTPNKNWYRWILISAIKHFKDIADTNDIHFYIRDTNRQTSQETQYIEFNMDGPIITQLSANYFRLLIGINVYYSVDISNNFQDDVVLAGIILEAFSQICVRKYGSGVDDDDSLLETLRPIEDNTNRIIVNNFGEFDLRTKIKQGSVEAVYEIFLEN